MRILGPESSPYQNVFENLASVGANALFVDLMFPSLWSAALKYGIDPVGMVAQSGKETAWGGFTGNVNKVFFNTCGLKNTDPQRSLYPGITDKDNPLSHAMFSGWPEGAEAQAQHLRAYTGWKVLDQLIVDPRYELALKTTTTWCETWADLGGNWAPAADYGQKVEEIMVRLQA